ncbi:MAG: ATP-binding protein, partial [Chitinophagaceae bacterium]
FNFTCHNPAGFLIVLIPALINLGLILYILIYLPQNKITNLFVLFTFTLLSWQINDTIARTCISKKMADNWDTIFSYAWSFLGPFCLHFALLYCKKIKADRSRMILFLMYFPAFLFLTVYQSHFYPHQLHHYPFWGWVNNHDVFWLDKIYIDWIAVLVLIATTHLIIYTRSIKNDPLLKSQALMITIGISFPTVIGLVTQVIMPIFLRQHAIPITSTSMTIFSITTVLAFKKYKLFSATDLISSETLIESLPVMVFSIAKNGRLTFMNAQSLEVLGIQTPDIHQLEPLLFFIHHSPEEEKTFKEAWFRSIHGHSIPLVESSLHTPTGEISIILSANPIINNNQVEGVLFVARDITDLKNSELQLRYKEAMLEEAQQISHIGSWERDLITGQVMWTDEMFRITGLQQGKIPLTLDTFIGLVHEEDRERVSKIIESAEQNQLPFAYYCRLLRTDGREVIIYAQGQVTLNDQKQVIRLNGTIQDVTDLKNKEKTLEAQNLELKKINSELDKFVYSVSHDLRAPLTSILGIIQISEQITSDELMKAHLSMIKKSIEKLDHFILDILSYSKNSRSEMVIEKIDLADLVGKCIKNLESLPAPGGRNLQFMTEFQNLLPCYSDPERLAIVLNNLISNSILYSNPQADQPYVKIKTRISNNEVEISVSDNGIGIPGDSQDKIFDMFYRASDTAKGSGLGLYIVKETALNLKGTIFVESKLGIGTTFFLVIPNQEENFKKLI